MHRLAESFEGLLLKNRMYSKMIVKNEVLQQTGRVYIKKVPEKTFSFLQQFMMTSVLRVYNSHLESHFIEIGMNYTLKEKMGYDPVIHGNNDPLKWARTFGVTDWVKFYIKKQLNSFQKRLPLKVFNRPGIDEPDDFVGHFFTDFKIFGEIEDVNEHISVGLAYIEVYSEGDYVYKRY